jgi:hypothetical protein
MIGSTPNSEKNTCIPVEWAILLLPPLSSETSPTRQPRDCSYFAACPLDPDYELIDTETEIRELKKVFLDSGRPLKVSEELRESFPCCSVEDPQIPLLWPWSWLFLGR